MAKAQGTRSLLFVFKAIDNCRWRCSSQILDMNIKRVEHRTCSRHPVCCRKRYRQPTHISSASVQPIARRCVYKATNTLTSVQVIKVLDRLFAETSASSSTLEAVAQSDASRLLTSKTSYREFYGLLKDVPLPVSRETGHLLYMLVRSTRARNILEFGTSFGVSTIYLAAALRDNGGGHIITTEFEPSKIARAQENLTAADLIDLVEIREGDALQTLSRDLPETLDLVLLDGAKGLYADILKLTEPSLRPASLILADDAQHCPEFVTHMRSEKNRYLSVPMAGDLEVSMRL